MKLTKLKKTINNNIKLYFETDKNINHFANQLLAITISGIITAHVKSSKVAVDDTGKNELILTVTQEKDIDAIFALIGYFRVYKNDYRLYSTFTIDYNLDLSIVFTKLDAKEHLYRDRLYKHIFAIYSELATIEKKPVDEMDKTLKIKLGIESKRTCKIEELENYRNKINALLKELKGEFKLETSWEEVIPY